MKNKYNIGDIVYLVTDQEQYGRLIINMTISAVGLMYGMVLGTEFSIHYEIEVSDSKDMNIALNLN